MLEKIKLSLRLTGTDLDGEVQDLINACKADLKSSGIDSSDESDPLIIRAVTFYCKAYFGYANENYERLSKSYDLLKRHLSLCGEYAEVNGNE